MCRYTYQCSDCHEKTVHDVPMEERDTKTGLECEACHGTNLKRMRDAPATVWRGQKNKGFNNSLRD